MTKNSPIGFFDSGVGGLSVYSKFRQLLPNENTIYYGDLKNLPYGNKSKEELVSFARKILDFFASKSVKAVVIACNTSSALAYDLIKEDYDFKIYPIIQSSAKAISALNLSKIGVFATEGTVKSSAYKKELIKYNPNVEVIEIACPNWVSIVEGRYDGNIDDDIKILLDKMLEFNPEKIILGCTHYPYLLDILAKYSSKNMFIDPAGLFTVYVKEDLKKSELFNPSIYKGAEEFYVSAAPEAFVENGKLFYEVGTLPTLV